jgi:hypothetical protein
MTDYYPLIGKAVAGLEKNTGEARRMLYERARTALVSQLRNLTPPLSESDITRERLALEEAIRKVEAEAARRLRMEAPRPDIASGMRPGEPSLAEGRAAPPPAPPAPPPQSRREAAPPPVRREPGPPTPSAPPRRDSAPPPRDGDDGEPQAGEAPSRSARSRVFGDGLPLTEEGRRDFRDMVAEAENLGEKTAQASRSVRQTYAAVPSNIPEFDQVEPRLEPAPGRAPPPQRDLRPPGAPPPPPPWRPTERQPEGHAPSHVPVLPTDDDSFEPARSRKGLVAVLLSLFVILGIGLTAYVMRDRIASLTGAMRGLAPHTQREPAPSRPKIPDRVGQDAQTTPRPGQPQTTPAPQQQLPAVAQRVVLYEEDPADPAGKRYVGSAIWRTETVSPGSGQAPELAVRCDVEIPERRLAMTMSMRRNTDQALPASHTVEIMFNLPADFPFGGISNVPGILMKQAEQTRGAPLSGLAVKVTSGFFLLGLSSVESEKERNVQLLKERAWFDIPVVYNNGRRAIVAVEKGNPGERAFNDAFAAWGQ